MSSKFKYMASKFSKCNEQCSGGPQEKIQAGQEPNSEGKTCLENCLERNIATEATYCPSRPGELLMFVLYSILRAVHMISLHAISPRLVMRILSNVFFSMREHFDLMRRALA